jgi:hypothetical protein
VARTQQSWNHRQPEAESTEGDFFGHSSSKNQLNTRSFSQRLTYKGPAQAQVFATQEAAEAEKPVEAPLAHTTLLACDSQL